MLAISRATHALAWVLLASVRTCLLAASSARAHRQLAQHMQSKPRTFLPGDHIVPESGQDVNSEQTFSISQPTFDSQFKVQFNTSWALDRLDQQSLPLDTRYEFPSSAESVSVYVLDSGILASHVEFETQFETQAQDRAAGDRSRARDVYTSHRISQKAAADNSKSPDSSSAGMMAGSAPREDCSGHGTHVASLIGGLSFGVAKGVQLKAVRVLACDGSTSASSVIDALDWLGRNAERPAIAVVAVAQTGHIPALEHAVERLVLDGVPVFAAAGNSDASACDVAPAYSPFAITVGASDYNDQRLQLPEGVGSNYGPCIDLFAPGQRVPGASAEGREAGSRLSGTSQAVALAAGAAALHMHAAPTTSPAQLRQALASAATVGQLSENVPEDYVRWAFAPYGASAGAGAAARAPPVYLPAAPLEGGSQGGVPSRAQGSTDGSKRALMSPAQGWGGVVTDGSADGGDQELASGGTEVSTGGEDGRITSYDDDIAGDKQLVATSGNTVSTTESDPGAIHSIISSSEHNDSDISQRRLFEAQGFAGPETAAISLVPGAKRAFGHAPLLQVKALDSIPLVTTYPAAITLLPDQNSANSSLEKLFNLKIALSRRADSDVDILIAETSTLRVVHTDISDISDTDTSQRSRARDSRTGNNSGRSQVSWEEPQRFGGPFAATLHKGAKSISLQLPLNDSLAMGSQSSGAFFLSVVITSDNEALDQKQIPVQVIDRKGWKASYPKVVMSTPYQDSMFTDSAGAELQKVMDLSPCLGSDRERQSLQLDGTPGDDVVYFFKPANACNAVVSLCGSTVATELIVLSHVDKADVGYVFIIRGRFGYTGQLKFRLECENAAGQLPSWAGKDGPLPSPLVSLEQGILHNSVASNAPQVPIALGWSPCAVQATPTRTNYTSSASPNEPSRDLPSSANISSTQTVPQLSTLSAIRVSTTSTLALLPGNNPKWCPFCVHGETSQVVCTTPPLATAADVISDAWSGCQSACRVDKSDRAQFCSVPVACVPGPASQSQQLCRDHSNYRNTQASSSSNSQNQQQSQSPLSSIHSLRTPQQQDPSVAFHVLQSPHVCGVSEDVLQDSRVQACSDQTAPQSSQCELPSWQWQEFGDCSKPCGGGTREMRVMCVAPSGRFREDRECTDLKPPRPQENACNTHACTQTMWHADKWGPCEDSGMHTRTVKCKLVEAGGNRVDVEDSQCELAVRPVDTATCQNTPDDAVFECLAGDCYKGNCTQSGAYCECELGWHGQRCDTRVDCPGLTSSAGDCCPNLRGADTLCCAASQVLDRNGMCCNKENLDVCRVCNGNATSLDLLGTCGKGTLDAGGLLCEGRLDECGVCGGTGLSCDMYALVSAALVYYPVSQLRLPLEQDHRQQVLQTAVLSARQMLAEELELPEAELGLNVSAHSWQGAEAASGAVWVAPLSIEVRFAPLAIPRTHSRSLNLYWLRGVLEGLASRAEMSLADDEDSLAVEAAAANGSGSSDDGALQHGDAVKVLLSGVSAVGREAVCGNAVCEVGELLPVQASGSIGQPCLADCPVEVIGCPQNDAGEVCSGLCGCDVGYRGEACAVCAPSHFLKDGYCVTPLISSQQQQSSGTSISPLVIVITVAALLALLFVLGVTCYAMYTGRPFCCWCFTCFTCLKRVKRGQGVSIPDHKARTSCTSSAADSLTAEVLRQSGGAAASGTSPGSPTCLLIDAFGSDQDPKRSDRESSHGELPNRAGTALDSPGQLLNSYSLSFQTATSRTSPARQRHAGARLAASLGTSDADKTASSAVYSPDDVSVQLPSDSQALHKAGVSPVATTRSSPIHSTPTKGGKFRWSEVQHESSAKLSHSSRVPNSRASTDQHRTLYATQRLDKVKATGSICDSPGEALGALINHWKRSSDVRGRRTLGVASWFSNSKWAADVHSSQQSPAQPDLAAFSESAAATAPFHGLESSSNAPRHPNPDPSHQLHHSLHPQGHSNNLELNEFSKSLSKPLPANYAPATAPPPGASFSQPVTYTSRSASLARSISASTQGVSTHQKNHGGSFRGTAAQEDATQAPNVALALQLPAIGGGRPKLSHISRNQRQRSSSCSRKHLGWMLHRHGSTNADGNTRGQSQAPCMGAMHEAESSLLSKQPSQPSDSVMPNSSSFWHASQPQPQRSHSVTSTLLSSTQQQQHSQYHYQNRMERKNSISSSRRRSSSLPLLSSASRVTPFAPPESPPSLIPPSTLPRSTMEGMGESTNISKQTPEAHLPVRGAPASTGANSGTSGPPKTAQNGVKSVQPPAQQATEESAVPSQQKYVRTMSIDCSRLPSSDPEPQGSSILADTSTDVPGSSSGAQSVYPRHIYHRISQTMGRYSHSEAAQPPLQLCQPGEDNAAVEAVDANSSANTSASAPFPASAVDAAQSVKIGAVEAPPVAAVAAAAAASGRVNVNANAPRPNSQCSNPSQKPANSEKLYTAANSTALWSPGMVPGDLSSVFASEEDDTFTSHRPSSKPSRPSKPLPPKGASISATDGTADVATKSSTKDRGPGTGAAIAAQSLDSQMQQRRQAGASLSTAPQAERATACCSVAAITLGEPLASSVGSAPSQIQHDIPQSTCPTPNDADVTQNDPPAHASSTNTNTLSKQGRASSLDYPFPDPSEPSVVPNSTLHTAPSSSDAELLSGMPKQPPAVFKNLNLYSGNASAACNTLSGAPECQSSPFSPVQPPCLAQFEPRAQQSTSTSSGCHQGQQYAANMLWKRDGSEARSSHDIRQATDNHAVQQSSEKKPSEKPSAAGLENNSAVGNMSTGIRESLYPFSPLQGGGESLSNQGALKTNEPVDSTFGGLSQYQSTQMQSEMHGNTNLSGLDTGNPFGCVLESGALEACASGVGPAPSETITRKSSLRSRSSTSRMVMSREQLAWEHFGSVSDGGALVPTTFNLGAIQNRMDLESTLPGEILHCDGNSTEGFGPVLHSASSHGFGMSADLGTEISNLMNKVQRMQSQAAQGLSHTSLSSSVYDMPVFSSPRGGMSNDSSFSLSRASMGGGSTVLGKLDGPSIVPSKIPDVSVAGDSMELNFMHGMAVWTHEDNIS